MELLLTKGQGKGLLGGVKFEVEAQVQLSDEENELIQHYNLQSEVLLSRELTILGRPTGREVTVTVSDLVTGEVYKCQDLSEVIAFSDNLVEACKTLKSYLEAARSFDGQEVIEIN